MSVGKEVKERKKPDQSSLFWGRLKRGRRGKRGYAVHRVVPHLRIDIRCSVDVNQRPTTRRIFSLYRSNLFKTSTLQSPLSKTSKSQQCLSEVRLR